MRFAGDFMKGICCWSAAVLVIAVAVTAFSFSTLFIQEKGPIDLSARSLAVGDPVAVIAPLPESVSNGSFYDLDASDSYDTDGGFIKDRYWEIEWGTNKETSHASLHRYLFRDLGLYKITLTVTDNANQTDQAFTAVVAILDKDSDFLADWWEIRYFNETDQMDTGDYDLDGYSNLEEFSKGTDPTVKDPQPNFLDEVAAHWYVFALVAAIVVSLGLSFWPILRKRRQVHEKKKIEAAIAIEKELEREDNK